MRLSKLIEKVDILNRSGEDDPQITGVCFDTRKPIEKGSLFICIKGARNDSHDFAAEAVRQGAVAVLAQDDVRDCESAVVIRTTNTRRALSLVSAAFFDYPARKLTTIALTGTKGKSTTAFMIRDILNAAGHRCGIIGTIGIAYGNTVLPTNNSTPESYIIQKSFADMVEAGCDFVVMEVSSQGLMQNRVYGIEFDAALFTNLEPDHIGDAEHSCFEEYLYCKSILFRNCKQAFFNVCDKHLPEILKAAGIQDFDAGRENYTVYDERFDITEKSTLTKGSIEGFMVTEGEVDASGSSLFDRITVAGSSEYTSTVRDGFRSLGISFDVLTAQKERFRMSLSVPGAFNVFNATAAISVCTYFGVHEEAIRVALADFSVCGRLEPVHVSEDFSLFIDYAHNAMALENVLSTLRAYKPDRLICLFGCGGNRSKDRRYSMGEVSSKMADLSVVTSDNPRYERPADIIDDILIGIKKADGKYIVIENRREAIDYVLREGRKGDIIILAGKGNEDYQEIEGVKYPFDERKVIGELLCTRT